MFIFFLKIIVIMDSLKWEIECILISCWIFCKVNLIGVVINCFIFCVVKVGEIVIICIWLFVILGMVLMGSCFRENNF